MTDITKKESPSQS